MSELKQRCRVEAYVSAFGTWEDREREMGNELKQSKAEGRRMQALL